VLPTTMSAVILTGHGGPDKLEYQNDVPLPRPGPGEVLVRVGACGMNNTDINTRTAWYSKTVTDATSNEGYTADINESASTWGGAGVSFPRIQGADITGSIVAVGENISESRIGDRVLVDPWLRDAKNPGDRSKAGYLGSERDGGFSEFATVPGVNAYAIESELSDAELATFPCSSSTAEYMLTRADLKTGECIVVTGASGGVGSALVQLAKRRGAFVIAIGGASKLDLIRDVGADIVLARDNSDLKTAIRSHAPDGRINVVADIVGGSGFPMMISLLARGGRYVTSGAIAGPIAELDLRILYLRDLTLFGATVMPPNIFKNLVGYIEQAEIRPMLAKTFKLKELGLAQEEFLQKKHVGNFVINPRQ